MGPRTAVGLGSLVVLLVLGSLAVSPTVLEAWYVQGLGPALSSVPLAITRQLPFSAAEWTEGAAIVVGLVFVVERARAVFRARGARLRTLGRAVGTVAAAALAVLAWFYATWGLSYARAPLDQRLGWVAPGTPPLQADREELIRLGGELVDRVNGLYLELHAWPDALAPTVAPRGLPDADAAVDRGWARSAARLGLEPDAARSRGPTKPLISSPLFTLLGIGGFYFPFTAEANLNAWAPEWQQPHTMAHEKAHQRFVASEAEANFLGFVACVESDDPFVQYSGWIFAQRQVLRELQRVDYDAFTEIVVRRLPGVQRDVNHAHAFWTRYDGPVAELGTAVNHAYLRINQVEGGVGSYGRSLELVVQWARQGGAR